ncbi:hypothetical protein [Nonomuraea gerenzanensis]|uniref:hypothetical protein n=1 Tax=Nonomuraea gerenzanensis TaxID=93944 RepID=UPI001CD9CF19|nr:hypothetical protein [Nonomuraea gerenzanensis]UBU10299.1 hypothetical protein LCN96_38950 [Nonomuraea gerenzanensis]
MRRLSNLRKGRPPHHGQHQAAAPPRSSSGSRIAIHWDVGYLRSRSSTGSCGAGQGAGDQRGQHVLQGGSGRREDVGKQAVVELTQDGGRASFVAGAILTIDGGFQAK